MRACQALQQEEARPRQVVAPVRCGLGGRKYACAADGLRHRPGSRLQPARAVAEQLVSKESDKGKEAWRYRYTAAADRAGDARRLAPYHV